MEQDTLLKKSVCSDTVYRDTLPKESVYSDTVYRDTLPKESVYSDTVYRDTLTKESVCSNTVYQVTLTNIRAGLLPESLDAAAETIAYLAESARISIPSMAMLLAYARKQFNAINDWVEWAEKYSGLEGDDLHHRRAIGDILLDYRSTGLFSTLFSLDQQKLLALYRIYRTQTGALTPFLARYPEVKSMTRAQVRLAVADWLGENKQPKEQMLLPGFERFVAAITSASDQAIATMVTSHAQAASATETARKLVDAAKAYFGINEDMKELVSLKSSLKHMMDELDSDIASFTSNLISDER